MTLPRNFLLFIVGIVLFAAGLACGLSGAPLQSGAPNVSQSTQIFESSNPAAVVSTATAVSFPSQLENPSSTPQTPDLQPTIPESRRLTLEFPPRLRVGDSDVVRLTLEVDALGNVTPTAEIKGNIVSGKIVTIPNVYDTHNVFAEARMDIAGLNIQPPDVQSESLTQGEPVTFYWSVQATTAGTFRGTVWFYLRFVDKVSSAESRQTVSAQPVEIAANDFFGFSGGIARAAGGIGSIVGAVLGFPFVDDILKWLLGRLRKSK